MVNTLGDGSTVVYSDPDAAQTMWEIRAKGLTAAEWNSIEALFDAVAGQWQTFTLLDPAGNLFADSELLERGGVDQWSADRADGGDRRSAGNDAGDAGGERRDRGGGG